MNEGTVVDREQKIERIVEALWQVTDEGQAGGGGGWGLDYIDPKEIAEAVLDALERPNAWSECREPTDGRPCYEVWTVVGAWCSGCLYRLLPRHGPDSV